MDYFAPPQSVADQLEGILPGHASSQYDTSPCYEHVCVQRHEAMQSHEACRGDSHAVASVSTKETLTQPESCLPTLNTKDNPCRIYARA
jgi:hypothetical protein